MKYFLGSFYFSRLITFVVNNLSRLGPYYKNNQNNSESCWFSYLTISAAYTLEINTPFKPKPKFSYYYYWKCYYLQVMIFKLHRLLYWNKKIGRFFDRAAAEHCSYREHS